MAAMLAMKTVFPILLLPLFTACASVSSQITPETLSRNFGLEHQALASQGIAFLTPASVTGQEQDRQALALIMVETLKKQRADVRVVSLPETLSAINRAGLAKEYRQMSDDYRDSGLFARETLRRLGEACEARFVAQIKLSNFSRDMRERFSLFGFRLLQTQYASVRLYLQIWDTATGSVVWEGLEELQYAYDSGAERPVTFRVVAEHAAKNIIKELP